MRVIVWPATHDANVLVVVLLVVVMVLLVVDSLWLRFVVCVMRCLCVLALVLAVNE